MTIIAKHGDLQVIEYSGGYAIDHVPTGLEHWMSDGVDMFRNPLTEEPISPGTYHFNLNMQVWLRESNDLLEAYFPQLLKPRQHFIAMAGLRGYMPNYCDVYWTRQDAIESLCQIHDLAPHGKFAKNLKHHNYVDLHLRNWRYTRQTKYQGEVEYGPVQEGHGNEYAEVVECECLEPWIHSEEGRIEWE